MSIAASVQHKVSWLPCVSFNPRQAACYHFGHRQMSAEAAAWRLEGDELCRSGRAAKRLRQIYSAGAKCRKGVDKRRQLVAYVIGGAAVELASMTVQLNCYGVVAGVSTGWRYCLCGKLWLVSHSVPLTLILLQLLSAGRVDNQQRKSNKCELDSFILRVNSSAEQLYRYGTTRVQQSKRRTSHPASIFKTVAARRDQRPFTPHTLATQSRTDASTCTAAWNTRLCGPLVARALRVSVALSEGLVTNEHLLVMDAAQCMQGRAKQICAVLHIGDRQHQSNSCVVSS